MITHRFLSLTAAALITSAQWTVFFYPNVHLDFSQLAAAAMVAQNAPPAVRAAGAEPGQPRGTFLRGASRRS